MAFAVATLADGLSLFLTFAPPLQWVVDLATAVLLFVVLGRQWMLLTGLIFEAIPGFGVIPFWVLVVGAVALWGTARPGVGTVVASGEVLPPGSAASLHGTAQSVIRD